MKYFLLNVKTIMIIVGTMITLPFAHMAGQKALSNWAIDVERMYERLRKDFEEFDK